MISICWGCLVLLDSSRSIQGNCYTIVVYQGGANRRHLYERREPTQRKPLDQERVALLETCLSQQYDNKILRKMRSAIVSSLNQKCREAKDSVLKEKKEMNLKMMWKVMKGRDYEDGDDGNDSGGDNDDDDGSRDADDNDDNDDDHDDDDDDDDYNAEFKEIESSKS
jgi:hypothetical protein